mgnify:CR=1 FL=1
MKRFVGPIHLVWSNTGRNTIYIQSKDKTRQGIKNALLEEKCYNQWTVLGWTAKLFCWFFKSMLSQIWPLCTLTNSMVFKLYCVVEVSMESYKKNLIWCNYCKCNVNNRCEALTKGIEILFPMNNRVNWIMTYTMQLWLC